MPEQFVSDQAKECFTYSIVLTLDDSRARQDLHDGLLQIMAEVEQTSVEECKLKKAL